MVILHCPHSVCRAQPRCSPWVCAVFSRGRTPLLACCAGALVFCRRVRPHSWSARKLILRLVVAGIFGIVLLARPGHLSQSACAGWRNRRLKRNDLGFDRWQPPEDELHSNSEKTSLTLCRDLPVRIQPQLRNLRGLQSLPAETEPVCRFLNAGSRRYGTGRPIVISFPRLDNRVPSL